MKKYFSLFIIISIALLFSNCSENKSVTPPIVELEIFPSKPGTNYKYNVTFGVTNPITGTKKSHILSSTNKHSYVNSLSIYQPQIDSFFYSGTTLVDTTYFRKTSSGVFFNVDTTGFSQLIPDSLRNLLTVDTESRLLFFPLSVNQTWPVYQIDIKIAGVPVFSPIKASAKVVDMFKMDFVLRSSNFTTTVYKILYNLDLQFSPEGQVERQTAVGFFAVGIGFIKWDGQTSVINLVKGNTFNFPSDVMLEELSTFFIP